MAFNLLSWLIANPVDDKDEDVGSPVDDVGDEINGESDVDFDVEDREQDELDLSLNSSDDDDSETIGAAIFLLSMEKLMFCCAKMTPPEKWQWSFRMSVVT